MATNESFRNNAQNAIQELTSHTKIESLKIRKEAVIHPLLSYLDSELKKHSSKEYKLKKDDINIKLISSLLEIFEVKSDNNFHFALMIANEVINLSNSQNKLFPSSQPLLEAIYLDFIDHPTNGMGNFTKIMGHGIAPFVILPAFETEEIEVLDYEVSDEMEMVFDKYGQPTDEQPKCIPIEGTEHKIDVLKNVNWLELIKSESSQFGEIAFKNILKTWPTREELVALLLEDMKDEPSRQAIEKKMNNLLPCPLHLIKNLHM
jgi:hypothetical protein